MGMTANETMDGLQEIIDRNQKTILPRVHIGYLIHAVKYLKEQKEEIENLKQTVQSMMEGICLLKEQDSEKKRIMKVIWDVLHEGFSIDTTADQDWVYEQIRHRIEDI